MEFVLNEYEHQQTITNLFVDFIDHAQTFDTAPNEILDRLPRWNPRKYHFGVWGARLLKRYEEWKTDNDLQDFDDMIYNAINAISDRPARFREQYNHLMVDEFQDVAISQIRLIKQLTAGEEGPRLFCVGDDWQSIYAFRGAVVEYFIDFEAYFGRGTRTELSKTYRCPETVLAASTDLIRNNPKEIDKEPEPCSGRDTSPRLHTVDGYNDWVYARRVGDYTATLVELWDDTHETKAQAGRLTDDSGSIKFVAWANTNPSTVREGFWYEFTDVEVSEYKGDQELHFTTKTTIEEFDG